MSRRLPSLVVLAGGRARRYGGVKPLAPVGPAGEAVIDLLASDAVSAGFGTIILVVGPQTGPAIRYHVEQTWPGTVDARFVTQERPLGTVHAVLSAGPHLMDGQPFGVANADDLYGEQALSVLAAFLSTNVETSALVGFRLDRAIIGTSPVTRGICSVDGEGWLLSIDERRKVQALDDGSFAVGDGREPATLRGDELVSMNLWAISPAMHKTFESAMAAAPEASEEAEVLLPEVVAQVLAEGVGGRGPDGGRVRALGSSGHCVGVTHPDDLALVQEAIALQVATGERPARLWSTRP